MKKRTAPGGKASAGIMAESEAQSGKGAAGGPGKAGDQSTSPALAVIELFGGIRPMAKDLGVAVSTVQGWKERESIPANRHDQIRAAAGKKGLTLDAELLRAAALPSGGSGQPPVIEGDVQKPAGASDSKPAPAPSADRQPETAAEKSTGAATATQSSAASRASQATRPAAGAAPAAGGGRGSLVSGLALGFVLAVAVAVGTIYTQELWQPIFGSGGSQENAAVTEALQALDQRLTALQADLPPDNSAALSDLNERLATLEAAVSQGAGQDPETRAALESLSANLAGLSDRIQAIEDRMQSIEEGQAAAIAPTAALSDRLSGEAARLDELLTAQSELQARLDAAEQDLAGTIASRDAAPGSQETLLLLAALQLRDAIRGSGPYEEPLRMLQNLTGDDAALAETIEPLARRAPAGLPSLRDLQADFPEVARRVAAIELGEEGEGWSAGVLRRLSEAVNLRPVGLVEGDQPTAVVARSEVKLNEGDLAGALAELGSLTGAAAEAAAAWRGDAEARIAADQAVSRLGALVSERFRLTAGG